MDIHVQHLKGFDLSIVVTGSTLTKQYSSTEMYQLVLLCITVLVYSCAMVFAWHLIVLQRKQL